MSLHQLQANYSALQQLGLKLDLTRGKPSSQQLDLSVELLGLPGESDFLAEDKTDIRNYGGLQGLVEARRLFTTMVGAPHQQIIVGNNASLALMHDVLIFALLKGT
jgi:hypothetical protein